MVNKIIFYCLSSVYLALCAEIGSAAYFYYHHGQLYYTFTQKIETADNDNTLNRLTSATGMPSLKFHPNFGFVNDPSQFGMNNAGFREKRDFPYLRQKNDFIILVVGGSVASNFVVYENKNNFFKKRLKNLRPDLTSRNVVLLNLSKEAFRQPQQLAVLSYYLLNGQDADLVININGFNEITSSWDNNVQGHDLVMPSGNLLRELQKFTRLDEFDTGTLEAIYSARLAAAASSQPLATSWFAIHVYSGWLKSRSLPFTRAPESSSDNAIFLKTGNIPITRKEFLRTLEELYAKASAMTQAITNTVGVPYLEILQPNQYFPTKRKFTPQERAIAFVPNASASGLDIVEPGYLAILGALADIPGSELWIADGTKIFDYEVDAVYRDNCCHYNDRGKELLALFIAEQAARILPKS